MSRFVGYYFGGLAALLALLALAWLTDPAAARPYLAVELIRFELGAVTNGVEIEWETATETDVAYFKVKRGPDPNGPFADLSEIGLVPAEGSTFSGAVYTEIDQTAAIGQVYRYQLYEISLSNAEKLVGAATISLAPTATPEIIGGGDPGVTSTPAPTSTLAGAGGSTPTPGTTVTAGATAPALTVTATITTGAELDEPDATLPATTVARALGPTPTRFSFTPSAPGSGGNTLPANTSVAEAAEPDNPIQGSGDAVPAPAPEVAFAPLSAGEAGEPATAPQQMGVPVAAANRGGGLPDSVGRGQGNHESPQAGDEAAELAQETSSTARLLLWFGFIAGLFIFIAGIAVSIILSTRRRHGGPLP